MELSDSTLMEMYRTMVRIREFDERAVLLSEQARIPGPVHLCVGQEAVAVGVCFTLNRDDYIAPANRAHGYHLAKGAQMDRMMAELYGKATGYNKGRGGSMHVADMKLGNLGPNGILGAGAPIAVGAAYACRYYGRGQVVVAMLGDAAAAEGAIHEAMNLAGLWKLPVIFLCENNLYGEFMPLAMHSSIEDIVDRAAGYNMPGMKVDGMDAIAVYEGAAEAVARARRGEGPTLVECKTYRFYDHVGRDYGVSKRPEAEVAYWKARDPIKQLRTLLVERGAFDDAEADRILEEARAEVEAAVKFAEQSPYPDPSTLLEGVYTEEARA